MSGAQRIKFDASRKSEIIAAMDSWNETLPKTAGQLGSHILTYNISGPDLENKISLGPADPAFIEYLRGIGFQFDLV